MSALIQPSAISFPAGRSLAEIAANLPFWKVGALILPAATILYFSFTPPYDPMLLHRNVLIGVRYASFKRNPE